MAIREVIDKTFLQIHPSENFSHPIPALLKEAETSTDRIVSLWADFCKSLSLHLKNSKCRRQTNVQRVAFLNGIERICSQFTRCCENATMKVEHRNKQVFLRIHRLDAVADKDRHQNQSFVAYIPEYETTVPARATFIGLQDCDVSLPPVMVEAVPLNDRRVEATHSLPQAEAIDPFFVSTVN